MLTPLPNNYTSIVLGTFITDPVVEELMGCAATHQKSGGGEVIEEAEPEEVEPLDMCREADSSGF